jgi:transposase
VSSRRSSSRNAVNFLFFGNEDAARKICVLYSLVASCEGNGVNPTAYLTDVLLRIQTQPRAELDELLPHRWKPATAGTPA